MDWLDSDPVHTVLTNFKTGGDSLAGVVKKLKELCPPQAMDLVNANDTLKRFSDERDGWQRKAEELSDALNRAQDERDAARQLLATTTAVNQKLELSVDLLKSIIFEHMSRR